MSTERTWTAEQRAAINERRAELMVSAAAGSGKTAVLIERIYRGALGLADDGAGGLAADPAQRTGLERMLVVTFTNAAAAELRQRLTEKLNAEYAKPAAERVVPVPVIREQLASLPRAQISTFHGFCGEIVRRWGHLSGIGYDRVLAAEEAELIRHELATRFLDERLGEGAALAECRLALAWGGPDGVGPEDLSRVRYAGGLRRELLKLLDFRRTQPDPEAWFRRTVNFGADEFPPLDARSFDPAHPLVAQLGIELGRWTEDTAARLEELAARLETDHHGAKYCELVRRLVPRLRGLNLEQGWSEAAQFLELRVKEKQLDIKQNPSLLQAYRYDLPKDDPWYERLPAEHKPLADSVAKWQKLFQLPWGEVARAENETRELLSVLWRLVRDFDQHYRDYKRGRNVVDFDDMQLIALDLLSARDGQGGPAYGAGGGLLPSEVALELRRRFEMVLVDEHQDTNEVQEAIIALVTRDAPSGAGRPLFRVGDLKQSIYTFRLAVPQLFSAACECAAAADDDRARLVKLQANFRSRPQLLSAINHLFDGVMTPELGGEDYADNRLLAQRSHSTDDHGPAELHLVVTDRVGDEDDGMEDAEGGDEEDLGRLERLYAHVAQTLAGMHQNPAQPVYDRDGNARPADWRDMVVLMRSTAGRIELLLSACARAGVRAYAPGRSGFYERPEVADALALLRVVDNPRRDIPLAAVLSGPAVGLDYAQLLTVARAADPEADPHSAEREPVDLWERVLWYCGVGDDEELAARLLRFRRQLAGWRAALRLDSVPELLWRIYADTGLLAASAALPNGEQRVANLYRLHELARQAAGSEQQSLARFLRSLELSRRAAGDLGEAPLLTEAQDVVRVMTVHQAKGLEFPIVVVPDLDKQINTQDLKPDVQWHRTAGAGGRWVEWPPHGAASAGVTEEPVARKLDTLGHLLCREAHRRDLVSEELRILYVALTRARDRLVLVGGITEQQLAQPPASPAGSRARCWLDWIIPQLQAGVVQASATGAAAMCGAADSWRVSIQRDAPAAPAVSRPTAGTRMDDGLSAELEALVARLAVRPQPGRLPAKLTVTRLAHQLPEPPDADAAVEVGSAWPRSTAVLPLPRFLASEQAAKASPEPAQIGTAAHLLLAELDFKRPWEVGEIAAVRDALVAKGRLETAAAGIVDLTAIAAAVATLRERLLVEGAQYYSELPVALLVPAADPVLAQQLSRAGFGGQSTVGAEAGEAVYVQGIIDLLVVSTAAAVVVDYKTDRAASAHDLVERHGGQLDWYCRAVAELVPEHAVRWAIYGLDGAGLVGPFDWPAAD